MFFTDELETDKDLRLQPPVSGSKRFESALDVSLADRYRNAPEDDSDDGVAIVVPSRATQPAGNTLGVDAKTREAVSVGEELLRGMVRAAKKEGREDAAKAMRAANQEALPKFVGGFVGAGGSAHASFEPLRGMVVCLTVPSLPPPNGTTTGGDGPRNQRSLVWKKESEISPEEAAFGHPVTDATVGSIFSVVRVTPKECEVQLADGQRKVVLRNAIRPATKPEQDLYDMWTRDPRTLPPESARRKRSRDDTGRSGVDAEFSAAGHGAGSRELTRWVLKHLVVRSISSALQHAEYLGKKFVVQSVGATAPSTGGGAASGGKSDKSKPCVTVMATPLSENGTLSPSGGLVQFLQQDLETVLPKLGERGLILAGPRRGSVAVLHSRVRDKETGEVTDVKVAIPREAPTHTINSQDACPTEHNHPAHVVPREPQSHDELVTLSPNDFCAFLCGPEDDEPSRFTKQRQR